MRPRARRYSLQGVDLGNWWWRHCAQNSGSVRADKLCQAARLREFRLSQIILSHLVRDLKNLISTVILLFDVVQIRIKYIYLLAEELLAEGGNV